MKKPWVIGLLSIVPGLGFILLGEVLQGLGIGVLLVLFTFLGLFVPWETFSIAILTIVFIAWVVQGYYAVVVAQRLEQVEAGTALPVRPVSIAPLPPEASFVEKRLHKDRQTVMELLPPGEHLKVAIHGATGTPALTSVLLDVAAGTTTSGLETRQVYLGITQSDFIFVETDAFGKPAELQCTPLSQIALVESREGLLNDEVIIHTGESAPLRVQISRPMRQATRQLVGILSSKGEAGFSAGEVEYTAPPISQRSSPFEILRRELHTRHPLLLSMFLGAAGGIIGTVTVAILSAVVSLLLIIVLPYTPETSSTFEGLGYLLGLYCLVMFPVGASVLGAIPALVVGALRHSGDRRLTPLQPLLAGFLPTVILAFGVLVLFIALS